MKHLFNNYETCAGVWAAQSQDRGHTQCGRMYFTGKVIYSYGTHFPLARIVGGAVLLNDSTYSVTTSKHQQVVRSRSHSRFGEEHLVPVKTGTLLAWERDGSAAVYRDYSARIRDCLITARLPRKRHATKLWLWQESVVWMSACLRFARLQGESVPEMLTVDEAREYQLAVAKVELGT